MKIGHTVGAFARFGELRYQKMKELGFDYADLSIEGELGSMTEEEYEAHFLREKELADKAGVTIWQVHGPWRWPPRDGTEEDRAERAEVMRRSIRVSALIGVSYWVIHPIMPYGPDKDPEPEVFWQMNLDFFRALLPTAKQYGVTICYENMPMRALSISTPEVMLRFVHEINDESFKFCLDTGHCAVFGLSCGDAVRMAGDDLKVLHVHDNSGRGDEHKPPFHGIVDWKDFYASLLETGFDGVLSLESGYPGGVPLSAYEHLIMSARCSLDELMA